MPKKNSVDEFWTLVERPSDYDCWVWLGGKDPRGYGHFGLVEVDERRAHRVSWTLTHGKIPDGLFVCHRCDNPSCVNPAHLFLGTHVQNMDDSRTKRRRLEWEPDPTPQEAFATLVDHYERKRFLREERTFLRGLAKRAARKNCHQKRHRQSGPDQENGGRAGFYGSLSRPAWTTTPQVRPAQTGQKGTLRAGFPHGPIGLRTPLIHPNAGRGATETPPSEVITDLCVWFSVEGQP